MNKTIIFPFYIWLLFTSQLSADPIPLNEEGTEGILEVGFILGNSSLSVDKRYVISDDSTFNDSFTSGLELGYKWQEGYLVETNITRTMDLDIFKLGDTYNLFQWSVLAGYSIDLGNDFSFIPKAGFSSWALDTEEGQFLHPGPEAKYRYTGTDFTYELGFEVPIGFDLTISLAHIKTRYRFGDISFTNLGMTFEF